MYFLCLTLGAWAQATPDTVCTMNCAHPGYRSLTQEVGGETIMREGEAGHDWYIVEEGELHVFEKARCSSPSCPNPKCSVVFPRCCVRGVVPSSPASP